MSWGAAVAATGLLIVGLLRPLSFTDLSWQATALFSHMDSDLDKQTECPGNAGLLVVTVLQFL